MRRVILLIAAFLLLACAAAAEGSVKLKEFVIEQGYKAQLSGTITASDTIQVQIYNERTMAFDADFTVSAGENVNGINQKLLKTPMSKNGEFQIIITADGNEIYRAAFYVIGKSAPDPCKNLINKVTLTVKDGGEVLTDGSIHTTRKIGTYGLKIQFPEGFGSGTMFLNWRHPPESANVHFYDYSGSEIGCMVIDSGFYWDQIDYGENVGGFFIETSDAEGSLADVCLYETGRIPTPQQQWQEIDEKLDILFVSTHQDDELLFFGGAIGYYSYAGKNTAVCYMADCGIKRYTEAMSGLWVLGVKNRPIFLNYKDVKAGSLGEAERAWAKEGDPLGDLVELYRKYQPDVVVCQDYNGEYGHFQHRYTAKLVTEAVYAAMDPEQYPESAGKYGVWEVKKLYVHLAKENSIDIDWDNMTVPGLGGISAIDLDKVAFNRHQSQLADFSIEKQSYKYDSGAFGLVYSAVGADVIKTDFFENIGG